VRAMQGVPGGKRARIVGTVREQPGGVVMATTRYGATRVIDMLVGDPLPRIC